MLKYQKSIIPLVLILFFFGLMNAAIADTIYVRSGAAGDGTSWANAYGDLQAALDAAVGGDQIWVSQGTYLPSFDYGIGGGSDAYNHFRMINGVAIYGGFASTGDPVWDDRGPDTYPTILSGDIGVAADNSDNCFHVFFHPAAAGLDATAILDGFTITGGNANDVSWPDDSGGGMYNEECSPTVTNCTFSDNYAIEWGGGIANDYLCDPVVTNCTFSGNISYLGGGMYNYESNPEVSNCSFNNNETDEDGAGGGMYNELGSPAITDCVFLNNSADLGGGIYNLESSPEVTNCVISGNDAIEGGGLMNDYISDPNVYNCTFSGNTAVDYGGGMENFDNCLPVVVNCTFSRNSAYWGGGMDNFESDPTIINCIFWGNTATDYGPQINNDPGAPYIAYSDIQGGLPAGSTDGGGNIDSNPLFADFNGPDNITGTEDDALQLKYASPCIDAADGDSALSTDLMGYPRYDHPIDDIGAGLPTYVDMGAHEFQPLIVSVPDSNDIGVKGQPFDIEWSTDNPSPKVAINLFKGNSKVLGIKNPTENDGIFSWKIPLTVAKGTNYSIKVTSLADKAVFGFSESFEIVGPCDLFTPIEVINPGVASDWEMGQTYSIQWTGGEIDQNVKILLFKGPNLKKTITTSTPNDGAYDFDVPYNLPPGTNYRIKVKVLNTSCSSLVDISDYFKISVPPVEVSLPDNSTTWMMGDTNVPINWSGFPPGNVLIKLLKGNTVVRTISKGTLNDGTHVWSKVPYSIKPGTNYRVKVISTVNNNILAFSDDFTIAIPPIDVIDPTSVTEWRRGYTHSIQWTGGKPGAYVKIRLLRAGVLVKTITSSTINDGQQNWKVPIALELGNDYSIEVIYLPNTAMRDTSDTFSVINSPVGTWKGTWDDDGSSDSGPLKLVIKNNGTLTGTFTSGGVSFPFSGTYTYDFATGDFLSSASGYKLVYGVRRYKVTLETSGTLSVDSDNPMTGLYSGSIEKKIAGVWQPYEDLNGTFTVNR